MKLIIPIFFILLLFNCSKTKKKEDQLFVVKNNFSVSGFYKKLDSLNEAHSKNDSLEAPITTNDKRLNKNYVHGAIHFLILDKDNSYYVIDNLKPFLLCGNTGEFLKQDSIDFIEKSNLLTDRSQPIRTSEITKILKQHQNAIVNTEDINHPLNISFALKNDTLKGSTMYHIISFMENNGMKSYTIRRMNAYELKKVK
ncbi:hypothetical protein [Chryseobacterium soli]|uniref:hypothetical protein n=1 Tax=Chryseobacterium soli TaxID=445961 RepID=UPI002955687E|nr:hypothetical protein [Chryseobacterium soli]